MKATAIKTNQCAVIYARISDAKQTGLGSQEARCREFAKMKGYKVVKVFQDDMTGSLATRPGMQAMCTHLRKLSHHNPVVIIDDISRLARGIKAHWELRGLITRAGGQLESPSIEFKEDSDSVFVENVLASAAQHQREKNAEQVKNRMRSRIISGYWCFQAPIGYRYQQTRGHGKVLVREEPYASILQEAFEGFASGRFETQAEVKRFLETQPAYPKDLPNGEIRFQRVTDILTRSIYAGMVEAPKWGIAPLKGQHKGIISFQTYNRIQDRLKGGARAPIRKDLNADFPLRGSVVCVDCDRPLTASWSKGRGGKYPYYSCQSKSCVSSRKSIPRAKIEGEFVALLENLSPTRQLFDLAKEMFRNVWDQRLTQTAGNKNFMRKELKATIKEIDACLDRIVEATSDTVVRAFEKKIAALELDKLLLEEKIAAKTKPITAFDDAFKHTFTFLSNPLKLWENGGLEHKRMVMKLAFAQRLVYCRKTGYRTPKLSSPFRLLGDICGDEKVMVHIEGSSSNTLFNELAEWNAQLTHLENTSKSGYLALPS